MRTLPLIAALSYLLGSIPFGYLLVRTFRGEDVRQSGSGNIGATNVSRKSPLLGGLTLLLDALKGSAAVGMAYFLSGRTAGGIMPYQAMSLAALFAVHPLHVESVAWITERKDVLCTLFGLLSLWSYVSYAQTRRRCCVDRRRPARAPGKSGGCRSRSADRRTVRPALPSRRRRRACGLGNTAAANAVERSRSD